MASSEIPKTMRAVLYNQSAPTLTLVKSHPVPIPNFDRDEHLLKVHSMSITKGELDWPQPPENYKNYSPGVDMSGVVVASPPGSKFPPGANVYMRTTFPRSASAREYTIGLGEELAFRPEIFTADQSATVPCSALTAWQALFVHAGLAPISNNTQSQPADVHHKKVLVIGASGSVGQWMTQLARVAGLEVTGTTHTRNISLVREFGAHETIDYTKGIVRKWLTTTKSQGKFDLVIDCVGGPNANDAWYAANSDHGLVLSIVPPQDGVFKWVLDRPEDISEKVNGRFFIVKSNGEHLQKITDLVNAGMLKTAVDSVFELEDYQNAFDRVDSGKTSGRVVIKVSSDC